MCRIDKLKGIILEIDLDFMMIKVKTYENTVKYVCVGWYLKTHQLPNMAVGQKFFAEVLFESNDNQELLFMLTDSYVYAEFESDPAGLFFEEMAAERSGVISFITECNEFLRIIKYRRFRDYVKYHEVLQKFDEATNPAKLSFLRYMIRKNNFNFDSVLSFSKLCTPENSIVNMSNAYYAYYVHHNSKNQHLVGYLTCCEGHSTIRLSGMACYITSDNCYNLKIFIDRIVMIRKFYMISEAYEAGRYIKTILCNEHEINILDYPKELDIDRILLRDPTFLEDMDREEIDPYLLYDDFPQDKFKQFKEIIPFRVVVKGIPNSTAEQTLEVWNTIEIENESGEKQLINLCLEQRYFRIVPILELGERYNLHLTTKAAFRRYADYEIQRIDCSVKCRKLNDGEGVFSKDYERPFTPVPPAIEDGANMMGMVTVKAVIVAKFFDPTNLTTRTPPHMNVHFLGTTGPYRHILHLQIGNTYIQMYLNNWERRLMPRLLIPNMEVEIRSAIAYQNFMTTCGMTTFKILRYLLPKEASAKQPKKPSKKQPKKPPKKQPKKPSKKPPKKPPAKQPKKPTRIQPKRGATKSYC